MTTKTADSEAATLVSGHPERVAGLIETRRSRQTGHMVSIYDGRLSGMDTEPGRWSTVCEQHSHVIAHATRSVARSWLANPHEWCDGCMAEHSPVCLYTFDEYAMTDALSALDLARKDMSYQEQAAFVADRICEQRDGLDRALAALDATNGWARFGYDEQAAFVLWKLEN